MIRAVMGLDEVVAEWVAHHPPFDPQRGFGNCKAIGFAGENGVLVAGVVFSNWSPEAGVIELSAAADSPRWLTRSSLKAIFGYVFDTVRCQMAVMRVSERNNRMLNIAHRFGFQLHRIPRLRGRNEDEIICTLTDDQWRAKAIGGENRQAIRADAA